MTFVFRIQLIILYNQLGLGDFIAKYAEPLLDI